MGNDQSTPQRGAPNVRPAYRRGESVKKDFRNFILQSPIEEIEPWYDVIVIGSGYGGAVAASRAARAGQKVCLLERGKEWRPGDFPETEIEAADEVQMTRHDNGSVFGDRTSLYDIIISPDVAVIQGCGLGGTSLINANVVLDCDPRIFEDEIWPQALRENLENLTGIDRQRVYDMMKPAQYPKAFPILPKLQAMGKAATHMVEDIEDLKVEHVFKRAPLLVNFKPQAKNQCGIPQPACIGCGNCCAGCNTGAKNTLNMNYLPDARARGAQMFTEVEVLAITQCDSSSQDTTWCVHFIQLQQDSFDIQEQFVRAKIVILGAGSLGSTNILMKSKQQGLDVSSQLGKRFTTNGDNIGLCYNSDHEIRPIGNKLSGADTFAGGPGPCVTGVIDMRNRPGKTLEEGYVLHDSTPPCSVSLPFNFMLKYIDQKIDPPAPDSVRKTSFERRQLGTVFSRDASQNTLPLLALSNDTADGEIKLDSENGRVWIDYPNLGEGQNFTELREGMKSVSDALKGQFISDPDLENVVESLKGTKGITTVHPLGGCAMADSGHTGVVNHMGQVFKGDTDQVHSGLYVIDGSVMPRSLGVSPCLTIAMVAERCMRYMAELYNWRIDYDTWIHLRRGGKVDKEIPGLRFKEKMSGHLMYNNQKHPCQFHLVIETKDVEKMIKLDLNHSAQISGTVKCGALSDSELNVSSGRFQLFKRRPEKVETREMVYKMVLVSIEGKKYHINGSKEVRKDSALELGLEDTTVLNITVHEGSDDKGVEVGTGKMHMHFSDFMAQMYSFEVTNTNSELMKLRWKARFGRFFMGIMWETYGTFTAANSPFDPDAPPREKRPLELNGAKPELFCFDTKDGIGLALTRYNGGTKGPLILAHGMGVSSKIYTLDTIDKNFLEFLLEKEYDVWILEWRSSIVLDAHEYQHTLDAVAQNDYPMAVDMVLDKTGASDVEILVHCVGSITFFMSLLSGKLKGKIRAVIASQVAFNTIPSATNWLKAHTRVPDVLHGIGVESLTAYTDSSAPFLSKLLNRFVEVYSDLTTHFDEHCHNHVCHRITFMYGLMWEHENLNQLTHDTLHEVFGLGTATFFKHLSACMRNKHLVDHKEQPAYLPDFNKVDHLKSKAYMEHMQQLNIPILFYSGKENRAFPPSGTKASYTRCKEAFPDQDYQRLVFAGYGHLDQMMGKTAEDDIYKYLLPFIDKYANSNPMVIEDISSLSSDDCGSPV